MHSQALSFKVVGYYSIQAAIKNEDKIPFNYLTHINLWFLNPDSSGNFIQDLSGLKPFIKKAHHKNVKVLCSIGGGSKQPQYHRILQEQRTQFINKLILIADQLHLDGIDVDLEGSDIDENYEPFIIELAQALHAHKKLITAAVAIYYKTQLSDAALSAYDFVNIMSYDRTGPWRPDKPGPHSTFTHAVEDINYFGQDRKLPKRNMTLGVPFYGYGYSSAPGAQAISMSYRKIIDAYPGSESVDEWLLPDGHLLYYNGIPTIKQKTSLAKEKASGIMIWQILGDAKGKKSLLKAIHQVGFGK
jgi:GH18 family chitinase